MKTTKADLIRQYFIDNPDKTLEDGKNYFQDKGINRNTVFKSMKRAVDSGMAFQNPNGTYDFSVYFSKLEQKEEIETLKEWKNEVRKELVNRLIEANNHETDSNQLRLNSKEIRKLLSEIY